MADGGYVIGVGEFYARTTRIEKKWQRAYKEIKQDRPYAYRNPWWSLSQNFIITSLLDLDESREILLSNPTPRANIKERGYLAPWMVPSRFIETRVTRNNFIELYRKKEIHTALITGAFLARHLIGEGNLLTIETRMWKPDATLTPFNVIIDAKPDKENLAKVKEIIHKVVHHYKTPASQQVGAERRFDDARFSGQVIFSMAPPSSLPFLSAHETIMLTKILA